MLAAAGDAHWWQRTHQAPLPSTSPVVRLHSLQQNSGEEAAQRGCGSTVHGDPQDSGRQRLDGPGCILTHLFLRLGWTPPEVLSNQHACKAPKPVSHPP